MLEVPQTPQSTNHISLLYEKLKDHSKYVWDAIEETQQEMFSGVTECIVELCQITKDLKQTVVEKVVVHTGVKARPDFTGTSGKDREQPKGKEKVARPSFAM